MRRCCRVVLAVLLSAAPLGVAAPAAADTVEGTRFDVVERAHSIDVRLDHGHATLVVTRTIENPGPKSDQAVFHLEIPEGAVATRLRTAGVNGRGETVWFEGELLEAEEAARRYKELTGIGGYYPKDPALLSWRSQTQLALQVFPVPARSTKVVEYTLRMPLKYENGTYSLHLPKLGTETMPAKLHVVPEHADDKVSVNGLTANPSVVISASRELDVELTPRTRAPIQGALASFGVTKDKNLVHARIDAAPHLSEVPANASVVVILDTSRSMDDRLEVSVASVRAYLSQFPGANVELLTFDRKVQSPFGGPLPVREVLSRLYALKLTTGNGSNLDDALARADAKLAAAPGGARRILVITDLLTRQSLTPSLLAGRTMTSGALVQMATVTSGSPALERDDDSEWAKLPRKTGGLLWNAHCAASLGASDRVVFEEWVRPKRIEKVVTSGLPSDFSADPELREGQGLEYLGIVDKGVAQISIAGELWSSPIRWAATPSADEGRRWAGLVFGTSLYSSFDEKEQMTLALHGRAVSPVTSYLAIEPGVRPSTEGLDWGIGEGGGGTGSGIGLGGIGTIGYGAGGANGHDTRQTFLDGELSTALGACGASTGVTATAKLESTLAEVVDVREVVLAPTRMAAVETCVAEKLWGTRLTHAFVDSQKEWQLTAKR